MKTNGNWGVVARIARRSQALAAFLVAALIFASVGRAQSSAAPAPHPGAKPAEAAPATPPPAAKTPSKGSQEGIKVHGHWTIEVRNPDGSLAKHVEFENSLVTPINFPSANLTGSQALVALLSGLAYVQNPSFNPWEIALASLNAGDVSPCEGENLMQVDNITGIGGPLGGSDYCDITSTTVTPPAGTALAT